MRIKSYTAHSMADAMNKVRLELGDDAIILSTKNEKNGAATVTAAIEQPEPDLPKAGERAWAADWDADWKSSGVKTSPPEIPPRTKTPAPKKAAPDRIAPKTSAAAQPKKPAATGKKPHPIKLTKKLETLIQALTYHGVPTKLGEQLCRLAVQVDTDNNEMALAAAIDQYFRFSAAPLRGNKPIMLVGPPGVGKTMTIAKMAAAAKLKEREIEVITTDFSRTGAVDQLKAFTDILNVPLHIAKDPAALKKQLAQLSSGQNKQIFIDTGGVNPYDDAQITSLTALILAAKATPLVVLAAGTDSAEMSDTAKIFAAIGAQRLVVTRLDTTRRYGGLLTAASNANLGFSYASVSSAAATGLHILTPVNLARLILRDPLQSGIRNEFNKASS